MSSPFDLIKRIKLVAVEDDPTQAKRIVQRLNATGIIEAIALYDFEADLRSAAEDADLVVLDVMVDGTSELALFVAKYLKQERSNRVVCFLTAHPGPVSKREQIPVNFYLEKNETVWEHLGYLLAKIFVIEKATYLLKSIDNLGRSSGKRQTVKRRHSLVSELKEFHDLLGGITTYFEKIESSPGLRYEPVFVKLRSLIQNVEPAETVNKADISFGGALLLDIALAEIKRLKNWEGVYVNVRLEQELTILKERLSGLLENRTQAIEGADTITPQHVEDRNLVFISYSHRDKRWLKKLQVHIQPYLRNESITIWSDEAINPGAAWKEEIKEAIASARVALFLVSPDFLASKFISEHEIPAFLKASQTQGLTILWVPVSHSSFEESAIKDYQAVSDPSIPLDSLSPAQQNKMLVEICQKVKMVIGQT